MTDTAASPRALDAQLVAACASSDASGALRVRFFVSEGPSPDLTLLDEVGVGARCVSPSSCLVVECVLPDGSSVEFADVRAGETVADIKLRLKALSTPPDSHAAADDATGVAMQDDDLDKLFSEFKRSTAVAQTRANACDGCDDQAARAPPDVVAAATCPLDEPPPPPPPPLPLSPPPTVAAPAAATCQLQEEPQSLSPPPQPPAVSPPPAAPEAACSTARTWPDGKWQRGTWPEWHAAVLYLFAAVSAWPGSAHVAMLCTVVALVATVFGYVAFCTLVVVVMYARVIHEQRAREAADEVANQMRAEVRAAHRQIAATVAALARADECSTGDVRNRIDLGESDWLNTALATCWTGWLAGWLSGLLSAAVADGLRQRLPPGLDSIALLSLTFDTTPPPRVSSPRALRTSRRGAEQHDVTFALSLVGEVALLVRLAARVSLLRATVQLPVAFRASEADVTVTVSFMEDAPFVRRVRVSLQGQPRVTVSCRPFGALKLMDVTELPGVDGWVQGAVEHALRSTLVAPAGHEWDVLGWWRAEQQRKSDTRLARTSADV